MPAQLLADDQKNRLERAMLEAVSRHGYAETTIAELVGLAGVSKSTFYQHFESKPQCFVATFERIVRPPGRSGHRGIRGGGRAAPAPPRGALGFR